MSAQDELVFQNHPKFHAYGDFLTAAVKPECRSCGYLVNFTVDYIFDIFSRSANWNRRHTKVISFNADAEEHALIENQARLAEIANRCPGPQLTELDLEEQQFRLSVFDKLNEIALERGEPAMPETRRDRWAFPLDIVCPLEQTEESP